MTLDRWEYSKRPLTADTTPADLDELGDVGWQLCGITDGIGFFRRSRIHRELAEQGEIQMAGMIERKL
jgi:hypothetical protein